MSTPGQQQSHWLAPYEIRHGFMPVLRDEVQLERHEILHYLRGHGEEYHRISMCWNARMGYRMEHFSQLRGSHALDFRNKTVPVYLLSGDAEKRGLSGLLIVVIHNYIYRKWFRPYRSDIECGQFVAKVVWCIDDPHTSDEDSAVTLAMHIHDTINTRLDSIEARQFYSTRPLFRAMAIIVPGQNYDTCGIISRVAAMPVLLVLTGQNQGLSAPVSFDSIADRSELVLVGGKAGVRTDLETAIDFMMQLEEREDAVFGPQPDPVASTTVEAVHGERVDPWSLWEYEHFKAEKLGWIGKPLAGPSSRWVSTIRYPDWTGPGARADAVVVECLEQNDWRRHANYCACGDSKLLQGQE
ncbi:hypothetical protein FZEAL_10608 [Fusarium zealandicum]|uniref:Uncharacterized protein n=1 Tax=Fusarium zealandicum TaxID=1053134 RepID=A0A8H4TZN7_9HYPO|nr:hypothetical protein FZEAL_10608 [Fusarium zealandicum]